MKNIKAVFLLPLLTLPFHLTILHSQPLTTQKIDSLVRISMNKMPLAGIAIGIVKDGEVILEKGYGITSMRNSAPVDKNTLFAIASNTKAFTAASLAILVDQGLIKWTDKVIDYIPEFRMYDPYITANFNIQDLLTHRSGLGLGAGDLMFFPDGADFSIQDVVKSFQYQTPASAFRTQYDYDNLLYLVAGEVVSRVSGIPWVTFVEKEIMKPIGMKQSGGIFQTLKDTSNIAYPHRISNGNLHQIPTYTKPSANLGSAGGIYSSVSELCQWMLVHLNEGKYGTQLDQSLFSENAQREMWHPHINIDFYIKTQPPYHSRYLAYGLGWAITEQNNYLIYRHTGGLPGMLSRTVIIPELELGVVVLTNTAPGGNAYYSISQSIVDSYIGIGPQDWISQQFNTLEKQTSNLDSTTLAVWQTVEQNKNSNIDFSRYTGSYIDPWFGEVNIYIRDGRLWFGSIRSPKLTGPMYFYKGNTFAIQWEYRDMECDAFANFSLDTEGMATSISMKGISPGIDFSFDFQDLKLSKIEK